MFIAPSCSVPNLESADCAKGRDVGREFYSYHFGNDMTFSAENLEKRSRFLTTDFYEKLTRSQPSGDPFTRTTDPPKAFRVGECTPTESGVRLNVLLFWKTDATTEQRPIKVDVEKLNDEFRIKSVSD